MTFVRRCSALAWLAAVLLLAELGSGAPGQRAASPKPAIVFTARDLMETVRTLAAPAMQGRRTGTTGNARAREWIVEQFKAARLEPVGGDYRMSYPFERSSGRGLPAEKATAVDVIGMCRGRGAKDRGAMVISAHYDHLGIRNGVVYPGADDNASGVAVLLALARECRQTPWMHDAVFAAFDAEEGDLGGARGFVSAPPLGKDRLAVNINLDMVSRSDKRELYASGTSHTPSLRIVLQPVASRAPIKLLFGHDTGGGLDNWTLQSDHAEFHRARIPFVYFGVEDHRDYHRPTDTPDKIDQNFFYQAALTILDAIGAVDRALPLERGR